VQGEGLSANSRIFPQAVNSSIPAEPSLKRRWAAGHYEMIDVNGAPFSIDIPVFRLAVPTLIH
jgi:uncharacterized protein affecting Mg2+/Co2+ transport